MIDIVSKLDEQTAKKIKAWGHPTNRASEIGHPCIRFLVASRLNSELKELHDVELQRIFDEGNLHEIAVLREIEDAGFEIIEQQRAYEWKKFCLSGHIDAKIRINGDFFPLEIKSCSPNIFPHIQKLSPEEMLKSKYFWVRRYPAQILSYCMMEGVDYGIILFKNKSTGEKCQKDFYLNDYLDYMESLLQKLEIVNAYVEKKELPPVEQTEECDRCGFAKTSCFPGKDYGPGFDILTDEEIEAKLVRWEEIKELAKEFSELDKELKTRFKGTCAIVGEWKIESKEYERTNYIIPDDVKKQYAEKSTYWRTSIKKL